MPNRALSSLWEADWIRSGHCRTLSTLAHWNAPPRIVDFPAYFGALARPGQRFLFDTGYAPRFHQACSQGLSRLHALATPATVYERDSAKARMGGCDIDGVFVSHWHADHAGGLLDFPRSALYFPPESATFAQDALASWAPQRHGLLPGLFPPDAPGPAGSKSPRARELGSALRLPIEKWPFLSPLQGLAKDPLGDGSLAAIDLPGHAVGHFGLLAQTLMRGRPAILFFCSDAVWSERELESRWKLGPGACLGFHSWSKARMTREIIAETVAAAHRDGLDDLLYVLPAHCERSAERFSRAKRGLP